MDRQEAIEFLVDHYENPRNYGPLEKGRSEHERWQPWLR